MEKEKNLQKNKTFFDRWAGNYDAGLFQFWMRRFYLPVLEELGLHRRCSVVDVSCGTGELLLKLHQLNAKAELTGVDFSEEMLKMARLKLPSQVALLKADVHHLPFADNTFDYVVTTEAFHHYYDQELALKEMVRVAKNGGKVMVSDINFFLKPVHWFFAKCEPGCVKINSRKEMKRLFSNVGLKDIRQRRNFLFAVMTVGEK